MTVVFYFLEFKFATLDVGQKGNTRVYFATLAYTE